jgi:hypothetical protein
LEQALRKTGQRSGFSIKSKEAVPRTEVLEQPQLISYMRLLRVNLGILLGETLRIYYELPNDNKPPAKINGISFNNNLAEGINFIKLLSRNEYSFEKLQAYKLTYERLHARYLLYKKNPPVGAGKIQAPV